MKKLLTILIFLISSSSIFAQLDLLQPSGVVYDQKRDVYYVANTGQFGVVDGYLLEQTPEGERSYLIPDILEDPRAMVIIGDTLFVLDKLHLKAINLESKQIVHEQIIDYTGFLTGICADNDGNIYVSNQQMNKIFRYNIQSESVYDFETALILTSPSGLIYDEARHRVIIAQYVQNAPLMQLDLYTEQCYLLRETTIPFMYGIARDKNNNYYITSWGLSPFGPKSGSIYRFTSDFSNELVRFSVNHNQPAALGYDPTRNKLMVPHVEGNEIREVDISTEIGTPSLLNPPDGRQNLGVIVELKWSSVIDAQYYKLQVSTDSTFLNDLIFNLDTNATTFKTNYLNPDSTYYWRVKAANPYIGEGAWTAFRSFSTDPRLLESPIPMYPADNQEGVELKPNFQWDPNGSTGLYEIQIFEHPELRDNPVLVINHIPDPSYQIGQRLTRKVRYYWRIRKYSGDVTSHWSDVYTFRTITLDPPNLTKPPNNDSEVGIKMRFAWYEVLDANFYHLQVSTNNQFTSNLIIDEDSVDRNYYHVEYLNPDSTYFWRVKANSHYNGMGPWSDVFHFDTSPTVYTTPTPTNPPDGTNEASITPLFEWETDDNSADFYNIEIFEDSELKRIFEDEEGIDGKSYQSEETYLQYHTYYWHVYNHNGMGVTSKWSEVASFTPGDQSSVREDKSSRYIKIFPNPTDEFAFIEISLEQAASVTLELIDINGNVIETVENSYLTQGKHSYDINGNKLASGVYIFRLTIDDNIYSKRMLLRK